MTVDDRLFVGDIFDVDNDGKDELILTDRGNSRLDVYSWNGSGLSIEATIHNCGSTQAIYHATAGDLDGDGTPEILFQCYTPMPMNIFEYDGGGYQLVGSVPLPDGLFGPNVMVVDDMESGDVDGDGRTDAVFCGNTGAVHVVKWDDVFQSYVLDYSSPPPVSLTPSQTCSVGDMTNNGQADMFVVTADGPMVYSHDGSTYYRVWAGDPLDGESSIAKSFVGDADNDGFTEFVFEGTYSYDPPDVRTWIYENDVVGATEFFNTFTFLDTAGSIIIADLLPSDVFFDSFESGDTSAWSATVP